jgi:hypothetical protein
MPKKTPRHKLSGPRTVKPRAIGELLKRLGGPSTPVVELAETAPSQGRDAVHAGRNEWRAWVAAQLPEPLQGHLGDVVSRGGVVTLFTDSAAWSARLRIAASEFIDAARARDPKLQRIEVKVMPAGRR